MGADRDGQTQGRGQGQRLLAGAGAAALGLLRGGRARWRMGPHTSGQHPAWWLLGGPRG
jgi:hypothetical protein